MGRGFPWPTRADPITEIRDGQRGGGCPVPSPGVAPGPCLLANTGGLGEGTRWPLRPWSSLTTGDLFGEMGFLAPNILVTYSVCRSVLAELNLYFLAEKSPRLRA